MLVGPQNRRSLLASPMVIGLCLALGLPFSLGGCATAPKVSPEVAAADVAPADVAPVSAPIVETVAAPPNTVPEPMPAVPIPAAPPAAPPVVDNAPAIPVVTDPVSDSGPIAEEVVISPIGSNSALHNNGILAVPELPSIGQMGAVTGATTTPAIPAPPRPQRAPTPREIALEIAPHFNVDREYARLTQCYGYANVTESLLRVQARMNGANSQLLRSANGVAALKDGMQPVVLAASTVRGEARFRTDYTAIGDRLQTQFAASRDPNGLVQSWLRTVEGCRADVLRWRTRP